jgi:hypothetical protein
MPISTQPQATGREELGKEPELMPNLQYSIIGGIVSKRALGLDTKATS